MHSRIFLVKRHNFCPIYHYNKVEYLVNNVNNFIQVSAAGARAHFIIKELRIFYISVFCTDLIGKWMLYFYILDI